MNREFPGVRGRRVPGRHRTVTHAERDGLGPGPNVSIIREGHWGIHPTEIRAAFARGGTFGSPRHSIRSQVDEEITVNRQKNCDNVCKHCRSF